MYDVSKKKSIKTIKNCKIPPARKNFFQKKNSRTINSSFLSTGPAEHSNNISQYSSLDIESSLSDTTIPLYVLALHILIKRTG